MIIRFQPVAPGIFRGGAPTGKDVVSLKEDFGINRIISLDQESGDRISRVCQILGIEQIMLPLDGTRSSLIRLLQHNLKKLLNDNKPTFFHCFHGKDRTGFLAALYEIKYLGKNPKKALEKAKKLGFGVGVPREFMDPLEKLILACKPATDINHSDIVSNQRASKIDKFEYSIDGSEPKSFAPILDTVRQYPYDNQYFSINDQSPTRENYNQVIKEHESKGDPIPLVGIYNNEAGIMGAGPVINSGGFIYD